MFTLFCVVQVFWWQDILGGISNDYDYIYGFNAILLLACTYIMLYIHIYIYIPMAQTNIYIYIIYTSSELYTPQHQISSPDEWCNRTFRPPHHVSFPPNVCQTHIFQNASRAPAADTQVADLGRSAIFEDSSTNELTCHQVWEAWMVRLVYRSTKDSSVENAGPPIHSFLSAVHTCSGSELRCGRASFEKICTTR